LLHSDVVVQYSINDLNYVTSSNWENNLVTFDHINSIGNIMYSTYSIWLIITSIILLLAMVGAIVITIKPKDIDYETKTIT
jgi:NADH-ubiquinone oxidoreductase chain 6